MPNLTKIFFAYRARDASEWGITPSGDIIRLHIFQGDLAGESETPNEIGYEDVAFDTDLVLDGTWRVKEVDVSIELPVFAQNRFRFIIEAEMIPGGTLETNENPSELTTLSFASSGSESQANFQAFYRFDDLSAGGVATDNPGYEDGAQLVNSRYLIAAEVDGVIYSPLAYNSWPTPPSSPTGLTVLRAKSDVEADYPDNADMSQARSRSWRGVQFLNINAPAEEPPINPNPGDYEETQLPTLDRLEWDCVGEPESFEILVIAWDEQWQEVYNSGSQDVGSNKFFNLPAGALADAADVAWTVVAIYENGYRASSSWGFTVEGLPAPYDPTPAHEADDVDVEIDKLEWECDGEPDEYRVYLAEQLQELVHVGTTTKKEYSLVQVPPQYLKMETTYEWVVSAVYDGEEVFPEGYEE